MDGGPEAIGRAIQRVQSLPEAVRHAHAHKQGGSKISKARPSKARSRVSSPMSVERRFLSATWSLQGSTSSSAGASQPSSYRIPTRTRPTQGNSRIDRFYAKLKTPVGATPEIEQQEIALSYADPHRHDHQKLFPQSNWELTRWSRHDAVGFASCCLVALAILGMLWLLLNFGT